MSCQTRRAVRCRLLWAIIAASCVFATCSDINAASLTEQLARVNERVILTDSSLVPQELSRLASNAADFPPTATTPAFTYEFNAELGTFERRSQSLGPVFVERANTTGKSRFTLGAAYLLLDLARIFGQEYSGQVSVVPADEAPSGHNEPVFADR